MPAESEKQRRFMGSELGRLREGKKTRTGMSEEQLEDFAEKPVQKDFFDHMEKTYGFKIEKELPTPPRPGLQFDKTRHRWVKQDGSGRSVAEGKNYGRGAVEEWIRNQQAERDKDKKPETDEEKQRMKEYSAKLREESKNWPFHRRDDDLKSPKRGGTYQRPY